VWWGAAGLAVAVGCVLASVAPALAAGDAGGGHGASMANELLAIIILLLAAKLGGDVFERFGQPAVLGELVFGVVIGNLTLVGYDGLAYLGTDPIVAFLAELGVILLLFEVGLESDLKEMVQVGVSAFVVAVLGVVAPFVLGYLLARMMMPELHEFSWIFIGATLCATSVGITARVMQDVGVTRSTEGRIILGAAVVDDVLGLVVLAVVAGLIESGGTASMSFGAVGMVLGKALLFLGGAVWLGRMASPWLFDVASKLRASGMLVTTALLACFGLAYVATIIGLAGIVGAFAAGLVMEEVHFKEFHKRGERSLEELIRPVTLFLAPIFFVRMGVMVDVTAFVDPEVIGFALAITAAAIAGKQVCAFGIVGIPGLNRIAVGLGMIPRGEVGLIFAGIGAHLMLDGKPVLGEVLFSAMVVMVMATTLVTPPILRAAFVRWGSH
jgi:Kef-type K+ transport system membrane component KefB